MRRYLPGGIEIITRGFTTLWRQNGLLHRDDGPAFEKIDGTRRYYRQGLLHREDGPAVIRADGTSLWFKNGVLWREDGPAVRHADGGEEWFPGELEQRRPAGHRSKRADDLGQLETIMEVIATYGFQETAAE